MDNCSHDFVTIPTDKWNGCVAIVCAYCGQIRWVYSDGRVVIKKDHGTVTTEKEVS